jgi:hypothetical protein
MRLSHVHGISQRSLRRDTSESHLIAELIGRLIGREIEPWQPSYKHELATAIALGSAAEEKLKYTLPARFGSLGVIFEDADKARLLT